MTASIERRALAAAGAVAATHGLATDDPVVIYAGSNVLVHLRPAPVVARVMTGTVVIHDDPRRWLQRELSVLAFLAPSGVAVTPSAAMAPGPHCHDGLWMTMTEWIADVDLPAERDAGIDLHDARAFGQMLRRLHDELLPCACDLAGLPQLQRDIERLLGQIRPADAAQQAAVASLAQRLAALTPVFESDLPVQALHGDVSLRNLLTAPGRRVWNDFEDTFRGPVHWDLASAVGSLRIHGAGDRAIDGMLGAYGGFGADELSSFLDAQAVYDEIWGMYDRQRRSAA